MELKYVNHVIILGFLILIIINQSYECSVSATNCNSCDDSNTKRTLSTNACPCTVGYFDNNNKVC